MTHMFICVHNTIHEYNLTKYIYTECIHVYMYTHLYIYIYVDLYIYIHACTYVMCMMVRVCVCVCACVCAFGLRARNLAGLQLMVFVGWRAWPQRVWCEVVLSGHPF